MFTTGNIKVPAGGLHLAPMEDVTDPPFRLLCRKLGADVVYTEFVSSDGLIRNAKKSFAKLDIKAQERPVGIQIFGADPASMAEAAKIAESASPDFIDINFGCPVKKVATKGAGAGLLKDIPKMADITREVVKSVKLPVTAKTRLGWDEKNKNIMQIAEILQDEGISALTIHGRTRAQLYGGEADWTLIGEVKNNPRIKIPIIGNGDINDGPGAKKMFEEHRVDGIMIGRAAIGNPWVFDEIKHYMKTGTEKPQVPLKEKVQICREHLLESVKWKGEKTAIFEMRKHYSGYFKNIPNFKPLRIQLMTLSSLDEVLGVLEKINLIEHG